MPSESGDFNAKKIQHVDNEIIRKNYNDILNFSVPLTVTQKTLFKKVLTGKFLHRDIVKFVEELIKENFPGAFGEDQRKLRIKLAREIKDYLEKYVSLSENEKKNIKSVLSVEENLGLK